MAISQIIRIQATILKQLMEPQNMCRCKVGNMDVISHAFSISRRIVGVIISRYGLEPEITFKVRGIR